MSTKQGSWMNYVKKQNSKKLTQVASPSLPPLSEYVEYLEQIWKTGILTHNGPLVREFEQSVCNLLGLPNFVAVSNGTIALQMAIKALNLKGEIITTPFSWIATVNAIRWENCTPVFCDIDPETLNIDVEKIESLITSKTVAILPVHVFGNPCEVEKIDKIASKNELRVIYDAAHATGSTLNGRSIFSWGDISTTSLHATKLLTCGEGGGCVTNDEILLENLKQIRFFGFDENRAFRRDGFNGKMSELHAALGICNLKYFKNVLADRKSKYLNYLALLSSKSSLRFQKLNGDGCNYSYFPIIFGDENSLLKTLAQLDENNVIARRYFYPSLADIGDNSIKNNPALASDIASRALCLPLHPDLTNREIEKIAKIIAGEGVG